MMAQTGGRSRLLLAILWVFVAPCSRAGDKACPQEDAQLAEAQAATAVSWQQLHEQFARYSQCDDGAIAEGFSDVVTRLLADQWSEVSSLVPILRASPDFRKFILRHIDETAPAKRLEQISEHAERTCPRHMGSMCRQISVAVRKSKG